MTLIDPIGYDPHPGDEWDELTCDLCGAQPVTLCAGMCHHYCDDHGPDDEDDDIDTPESTVQEHDHTNGSTT